MRKPKESISKSHEDITVTDIDGNYDQLFICTNEDIKLGIMDFKKFDPLSKGLLNFAHKPNPLLLNKQIPTENLDALNTSSSSLSKYGQDVNPSKEVNVIIQKDVYITNLNDLTYNVAGLSSQMTKTIFSMIPLTLFNVSIRSQRTIMSS
jgi:hypothetical protein